MAKEKFGGCEDGSGRVRVDNHEAGVFYDDPDAWQKFQEAKKKGLL